MIYPTEAQEQAVVIQYLRLRYPNALVRLGMEGIRLTIGQARKMKSQGMERGWPDIMIYEPYTQTIFQVESGEQFVHYESVGLAIELKRVKGGVISEDQKKKLEQLEQRGWKCVVCKGADEAIKVIEEYLGCN